jgi:archaeosine-15-forming tRNA-guanine transglycosylase
MDAAEMTQRLVASAVTIGPAWREHVASEDEDWGHYLDVAVFARHVVDLASDGNSAELGAILAEAERLLASGQLTDEAKTLLIVGFSEGVQNVVLSTDLASTHFAQWLGPHTMLAWVEVHGQFESDDS